MIPPVTTLGSDDQICHASKTELTFFKNFSGADLGKKLVFCLNHNDRDSSKSNLIIIQKSIGPTDEVILEKSRDGKQPFYTDLSNLPGIFSTVLF